MKRCPNRDSGKHLWTSRMRTNGGPWVRRCSWCFTIHPEDQDDADGTAH